LSSLDSILFLIKDAEDIGLNTFCDFTSKKLGY